MAAAATTAPGASSIASSSRFAAACGAGALGQYVKAAVPVRPLPLMPGADVDSYAPDHEEHRGVGSAPAQLTIVYGSRVLVLDDVPAHKAARLLRLAATVEAQRSGGHLVSDADLPVARKASLQRFMEKRKDRVAARAEPYGRPDGSDACLDDHLKLAL